METKGSRQALASAAAFTVASVLVLYVAAGGWTAVDFQDRLSQLLPASGSGSVIYQGVVFRDRNDAIAAIEEAKVNSLFPWVTRTPSSLAMMILAMAFGFLGGVARIVKHLAVDHKTFGDTAPWVTSLFGALTGLLLLGASVVVPSALASGVRTVRPGALLFLCLFGGMYSDYFEGWLRNQISRLLPIRRPQGRRS